MKIAVYAWEGMYQGLHGIEDMAIIVADEKNAVDEVNGWGAEAVFGLIESYDLIDDDDYNEFEERTIEDSRNFTDGGWTAYKVRDDVTLNTVTLEYELITLGFDIFVEEFCEKEPIV